MPRVRHVPVGRVSRPHGVRGEFRVDVGGLLPRGLEGYTRVYLGAEGRLEPVTVESSRRHGRFLLVKLEGCDSPEEARPFAGRLLYVDRAEMPPLADEEYYHADLVGCRLVDEEGRHLGVVKDVLVTGAHDTLVVDAPEGEWMLPMVREFVPQMDLAEGVLVARVPEGLRG